MQLQIKALYNLLRSNWLEDPNMKVDSWQVEDLRDLPVDVLFERLKDFGIPLTKESFFLYAENCNSPEELADCVWIDEEDLIGYDRAYLVLFELWRRLLPQKQSLSLFCDELDRNIALYDEGALENEEALQACLEDLEDILDAHVEQGLDPQEVMTQVSHYCAHDLETFIYDYIAEQIDTENELYASELLDGFLPYVKDTEWFEFLEVRLLAVSDEDKAFTQLQTILEQIEEQPDLHLLFEIGHFLVQKGAAKLFRKIVVMAIQAVETEKEYQDLLQLVVDYYHFADSQEEETAVKKLIVKREKKNHSQGFVSSDPGVKELEALLEDLDGSEV
jgi:hypothetical protein